MTLTEYDRKQGVLRFAHPELQGEALAADRLSPDEGAELDALVKRKLALGYDQEDAEPADGG